MKLNRQDISGPTCLICLGPKHPGSVVCQKDGCRDPYEQHFKYASDTLDMSFSDAQLYAIEHLMLVPGMLRYRDTA
jgi:hypothetical protein